MSQRKAAFLFTFLIAIEHSVVAGADVDIVAYNGQPFGVGTITYAKTEAGALPADGLEHVGPLALYPVTEHKSENADESLPEIVHFLFLPADTVSVNLPTTGKQRDVAAVGDAAAHSKQLKQWWNAYSGRARRRARKDIYPPEIDQYLATMLAQRIGQPAPRVEAARPAYNSSGDLPRMMSHMTGTESIRLAMQKEELLKAGTDVIADQPVPVAVSPPPVEIPVVEEQVDVEPMALAVPPECFYLRFGSYNNFVWFRQHFERWGSDLRDMVSARAINYHIQKRLEQQLQLNSSELEKLLGPAAISDVAIIGNDPFVREGAGLGIVFQARNNAILSSHLKLERANRASNDSNVTLVGQQFSGRTTSGTFLSSADNRIRSFYAVHGDYHLITTSRHLVERFLEVTEGHQESLGQTNEFRHTRSATPISRNDSAFLYLSDPFIRSFVEPAFRVEMTRRARSENQIQLVQFAQLAAKAEGIAATSIDELITAKLLPKGFAKRCDASALEIRDGMVIDTMRGARGSFVPIRDLTVTHVTQAEAAAYDSFSKSYQRIWRKMDPATVAISRRQEGNHERLILDLHMFPFPTSEYGFLSMFVRTTSKQKLVIPANAILIAEANAFGSPMFAGLLDVDVPFEVRGDEVELPKVKAEDQPWFLGSRKVGTLEGFLGYSKLADGEFSTDDDQWVGTVVGYRKGDFTVMAKRREVIDAVFDELKVVDAARDVQYRVQLGDFAKSRTAAVSRALGWSRAKSISKGNATLLNHFMNQLHVPADQVPDTVESLLQGTLVCPLGGDYAFRDVENDAVETQLWTSSESIEWKDYQAPFLDQLRGADFELTLKDITLTTHAELLMDSPDETQPE